MIKKADALDAQMARNEAAIARLEKTIDQAIENAQEARISVDIKGASDVVVKAIRKKYEDGGWQTKIDHGDQRDYYVVLVLW